MARPKGRNVVDAARKQVTDEQSKQVTDEQSKEPTRRLNVQISDSAYETLFAHMVRFRRSLGDLVTEAIKAQHTEVHLHGNPKRSRGVKPSTGLCLTESAPAESDDTEDRRESDDSVSGTDSKAA